VNGKKIIECMDIEMEKILVRMKESNG